MHCRIGPHAGQGDACGAAGPASAPRSALRARAAHGGPYRANSPGRHTSSGTQADARNQDAVSRPGISS